MEKEKKNKRFEKTLKSEKWVMKLIVDVNQLRETLSFCFQQPVKVKYSNYKISNYCWVYGEIPIEQTSNTFRFAICLLTGKALVLFIQSSYFWLTGQWEQLLIGGFQYKFKKEGDIIPIDYQWPRRIDFGCGEILTCLGWFNEADFRNYKRAFVEGLIPDYQNLWLKQ
jgi:hypothetical protein